MAVKFFESQQEDEDVVLLIRRHILALVSIIAIALLLYLIGFIAVFILPFVVPGVVSGFSYNVYVLFVSLLFLFTTVFLFNNWVLHYLHVAILTTEHFVEINQTGLFARKISEMALDKIQDVSSSQKGLLSTMFDIGQVEVQTAGEAPNFIIAFVPHPSKTAQIIMEMEEDYCTKHGLRTTGVNSNANVVVDSQSAENPQSQPGSTEPQIEYPGGEWEQK